MTSQLEGAKLFLRNSYTSNRIHDILVCRERYFLSLSLSPSNFKLLFGTISQTVVWSNLISLQLAAADGKNTRIISVASPNPSENRNFAEGKPTSPTPKVAIISNALF